MTPAKIKEHEPTTLKRKMTEKIAGPGQEKVLQKNRYGVAERARRMKWLKVLLVQMKLAVNIGGLLREQIDKIN